MNERITLLSENAIRIKRCEDTCCYSNVECYPRGLKFISRGTDVWWDSTAFAALRDAIGVMQ